MVPPPALTEEVLMYLVDPTTFTFPWQKKRGSSKAGALELGIPLSVDELVQMGKRYDSIFESMQQFRIIPFIAHDGVIAAICNR